MLWLQPDVPRRVLVALRRCIFIGALTAAEILSRYMSRWLEASIFRRCLVLLIGITLGSLLTGLILPVELVVFSGPLLYKGCRSTARRRAVLLGGGAASLVKGLYPWP